MKPNPERESQAVKLMDIWDTMPESERWTILHKTDLRGLQKCNAAAQPFLRIRIGWRNKLERAYALHRVRAVEK